MDQLPHLVMISNDPDTLLVKLQMYTSFDSQIIVSPLRPEEPLVHAPHEKLHPYCRSVYHRRRPVQNALKRFENHVHQSLKRCWRVYEAKGHHQELIMAFYCSESSLRCQSLSFLSDDSQTLDQVL